MKTVVRLMVLVSFTLTACVKITVTHSTKPKRPTVTFDGSPLIEDAQAADPVTPAMDDFVCADGMQFVPATPGHRAICIDITAHAASGHQVAANSCAAVGKTLCSAADYTQAINTLLANSFYWSADTSNTGAGTAQAYRFDTAGVNGGFLTGGGSYISLCCSR